MSETVVIHVINIVDFGSISPRIIGFQFKKKKPPLSGSTLAPNSSYMQFWRSHVITNE